MDILIQVAQFVLSLSLLIILHELGHFIPARIFKTRVEKFYLFFDPYFSLVKKKIGDTEYGIGWLPLGGYVKIAGMVDESMDTEQLKGEPQPWEFRAKPAWQRLIIMLGGVTVNVILAFIIYAGMLAYYGEAYIANKDVKYGVSVSDEAWAMGFRNGDKVLSVNGKELENFGEIPLEVVLDQEGTVVVERNGEPLTIPFGEEDVKSVIQSKGQFFNPRFPYVVGGFTDSSTAAIGGMQLKDSLVSLNGNPMFYYDEFYDSIPKYAGSSVEFGVIRDGSLVSLTVEVPKHGKVGVMPTAATDYLKISTREYSFFESIPAGIAKSAKVLTDYIRQFKIILNPKTEAYKEVGGFIMIANQFDTVWNWQRFWGFTAFLSIMLAFLNILPIPALDGGHVVFTLWEMISGKPAPQKVLEYAQMVGFILLLGLVLLVNGNDILKLIFN